MNGKNKVYAIRMRVEEELTKAHIEAKFAWDKGATESQMKNILKLLRQAQWRWDFAVASHGAAFPRTPRSHTYLGQRTR